MKHVIALSGGKDSTAMALRLNEVEPRDYIYVITPTGNENAETIQHWLKLKSLLNGEFHFITCGSSLQQLIRDSNALPNWRQRWCTRILKIDPVITFLSRLGNATLYVGIRGDEPEREGGDYNCPLFITQRFPMREWNWSITNVLEYNASKGISVPERTDCNLCFFQTLAEWWTFWKNDSKGWAEGESLEELTGHTFRSPGRDTWPASMKDLRKLFEEGVTPDRSINRKLKLMQCRVCRL